MAGRIATEATIRRDITVVIFPRSALQNATSNTTVAVPRTRNLALEFLLRKEALLILRFGCLLWRSEKYMMRVLRSLHTRGMDGKENSRIAACTQKYPAVTPDIRRITARCVALIWKNFDF